MSQKVRLYSYIALMLIYTSCQKDELLDMKEDLDNSLSKTIIIDGEPIYAGYGYDPIEDRSYRNAIDPSSIYESTDIQPALSIGVTSINDQIDIENHLKENYTIVKKSSSFLGLSKKTHTIIREIESYVKVDGYSISFIVKVKARSQRFYTDGTLSLVPPAQRLLDQQKYDQFIDNYGHFYVSDRTTGGEVIYTYTYDYCKIDKWNRDLFIKKTESKILGIFGKETTTTISESDEQHIEQAYSSIRMISSIPGFAPQTVTTKEQANVEIRRIQDYLNTNPEKASTIDLKIKPYAELVNSSTLKEKLAEREVCLKEFQNFEAYYDKVTFVAYNGTGFYGRLANEELDEYPGKRMNFDCSNGMPNAAAMFRDRYGNTDYREGACANYKDNFRLKFYVGDEFNNNVGTTRYTDAFNQWSPWASCTNFRDPDYLRIGIETPNLETFRMIDQDFRIAVQLADYEDGNIEDVGTIGYTPWLSECSENNNWSNWVYSDNWNFELIRFKIETRPKKDVLIKNFRIGVQFADRNVDITKGVARYTNFINSGAYSWIEHRVTDNNFDTPSQIRIYLEPK